MLRTQRIDDGGIVPPAATILPSCSSKRNFSAPPVLTLYASVTESLVLLATRRLVLVAGSSWPTNRAPEKKNARIAPESVVPTRTFSLGPARQSASRTGS